MTSTSPKITTLFLTLFVIFGFQTATFAQEADATASTPGTTIAFGARPLNSDAPIDVRSERLDVNESENSALFTGDVVAKQDTMTLYAPWVKVFYNEEQTGISHMKAKDGVTLIQGDEAAEGQEATYDLESATIVMTGEVLVTQRLSAIASDKMTVQLEAGTALMEGRVKTLLRPSQLSGSDGG